MCLDKYISTQTQRPWQVGPLTEYLDVIGTTVIGRDIEHIFNSRTTRVVFLPLGGYCAAPFRGTILLDNLYRQRPLETQHTTIVAHELSHLLQRDINHPEWFPSGSFKPSLYKRWVGDSTNYMEVLAYMVSWAIWHDLTDNELLQHDIRYHLRKITGDAWDACEHIKEKFYWVDVYKKNYLLEGRTPLNRIPPYDWSYWLSEMGFSTWTTDRIFYLAR